VDLWVILTFPAHVPSEENIVISQDGRYVVVRDGDWVHFCRKENNILLILWKFKPIDEHRVAISNDNKYVCASGDKWIALLDTHGNLIWEKDIIPYGCCWSPPYFISNASLIGVTSGSDKLVLIVDFEGRLIKEIHLREKYVKIDPIVVNNFIIAIAEIDKADVLRVYDWDGKAIYTFKTKGDKILAIACSLDGKYIAVSDNALRVYLIERED